MKKSHTHLLILLIVGSSILAGIVIVFVAVSLTVKVREARAEGRRTHEVVKALEPADVRWIEVNPADGSKQRYPLVTRQIVLDDPDLLRAALDALQISRPFSPQTPGGRWYVSLRIVTNEETVDLEITQTSDDRNGTLIYSESAGIVRWAQGTFRSDKLGRFLEELVAELEAERE